MNRLAINSLTSASSPRLSSRKPILQGPILCQTQDKVHFSGKQAITAESQSATVAVTPKIIDIDTTIPASALESGPVTLGAQSTGAGYELQHSLHNDGQDSLVKLQKEGSTLQLEHQSGSPVTVTTSTSDHRISLFASERIALQPGDRLEIANHQFEVTPDSGIRLITRDIVALSKLYPDSRVAVPHQTFESNTIDTPTVQCHQTSTPDCGLVATLNSIAFNPAFSHLLSSKFRLINPHTIEVSLFHPKSRKVNPNNGWELTEPAQKVTTCLTREALNAHLSPQNPATHRIGLQGPKGNTLLEMAFQNVMRDVRNDPLCGPRPEEVMFSLTGLPALQLDYSEPKQIGKLATFQNNYLMVAEVMCVAGMDPKLGGLDTAGNLWVFDTEGNKVQLPEMHFYSVLNIDSEKQTVKLLNPHQGSKPFSITFEAFSAAFGNMILGRTR